MKLYPKKVIEIFFFFFLLHTWLCAFSIVFIL